MGSIIWFFLDFFFFFVFWVFFVFSCFFFSMEPSPKSRKILFFLLFFLYFPCVFFDFSKITDLHIEKRAFYLDFEAMWCKKYCKLQCFLYFILGKQHPCEHPFCFKSSYQATLFFLKYLFIYHHVPSLYLTIFQENGWLLISDPSFDQVKLKYQRQLNPIYQSCSKFISHHIPINSHIYHRYIPILQIPSITLPLFPSQSQFNPH